MLEPDERRARPPRRLAALLVLAPLLLAACAGSSSSHIPLPLGLAVMPLLPLVDLKESLERNAADAKTQKVQDRIFKREAGPVLFGDLRGADGSPLPAVRFADLVMASRLYARNLGAYDPWDYSYGYETGPRILLSIYGQNRPGTVNHGPGEIGCNYKRPHRCEVVCKNQERCPDSETWGVSFYVPPASGLTKAGARENRLWLFQFRRAGQEFHFVQMTEDNQKIADARAGRLLDDILAGRTGVRPRPEISSLIKEKG